MDSVFGWYIRERIIFHRPVGELSLDGIRHRNDQFAKLLNKGSRPVHIIVDSRYITQMPTNLLQLSQATPFIRHPSLGWAITVSNTSLMTFLGGLLPQIGSLARYRVVSEVDFGLNFLKEQDHSLDWSLVNDLLLEEVAS